MLRLTNDFIQRFLLTNQEPAEIKEAFDLDILRTEKWLDYQKLNEEKTFTAFYSTCLQFLKENNDTFENRLKLVLLFTRLFGLTFTKECLSNLRLNQDVSKTIRGKWFIYIMDNLIEKDIKHLNMNSHIKNKETNKENQNKKEIYISFCEEFIFHKVDFLKLCYEENGVEKIKEYKSSKEDTYKIMIKGSKNFCDNAEYNYHLNCSSIWLSIGIDYYHFYIQKPSYFDGQNKLGSSTFYLILSKYLKLMKNHNYWKDFKYQKLFIFMFLFLNQRGRIQNENNLEIEFFIISINIFLQEKIVLETIPILNSIEGKTLNKYFFEKSYEKLKGEFASNHNVFLEMWYELNQIWNDRNKHWKPIKYIKNALPDISLYEIKEKDYLSDIKLNQKEFFELNFEDIEIE